VGCEGGRLSPAPPVLFVHRVNKNHNIGNNKNNNTIILRRNIVIFVIILSLRYDNIYFILLSDVTEMGSSRVMVSANHPSGLSDRVTSRTTPRLLQSLQR